MTKKIFLSLTLLILTVIFTTAFVYSNFSNYNNESRTYSQPLNQVTIVPTTPTFSPEVTTPATSSTTTISITTPNLNQASTSTPKQTTITNNVPKPPSTSTIPPKITEPEKTMNTTITQKNPPASAPKKLSWGVYAGADPTAIGIFEKKITTNPDYLAYFVHWGNTEGKIPTWLHQYAYDKGRTLLIFWEASDHEIGGIYQPDYSYSTIINGDHDAYLTSFAKQAKDYKGPIILVPFSELNGNWNPSSGTLNGNTPQEAVLAFRYVHKFFANVPNVKFGLAVNASSVPETYENRIEAYYPGSEYVDYVGVDGFNMGNPWDSFSDIFTAPLNTLSQYGKPMFVFSFASAQGERKAQWLNDALNVQMPKYPLLKGFVYFNQDKERNWLLWSDTSTLKVFTDYIAK